MNTYIQSPAEFVRFREIRIDVELEAIFFIVVLDLKAVLVATTDLHKAIYWCVIL